MTLSKTDPRKQIGACSATPARTIARMTRDGAADAARDEIGDEVPNYVERPRCGRVHHRRDAYLAALAARGLTVRDGIVVGGFSD